MLRATVDSIRKRSEDLDFSDTVLLALSIGAALASIAGIGLELHSIKEAAPDVALARAGVAVLTILISWIFLHTLFTIHYAHYFYGGAEEEGGLKFPDGIEEPATGISSISPSPSALPHRRRMSRSVRPACAS